jgi:hypothetical protein
MTPPDPTRGKRGTRRSPSSAPPDPDRLARFLQKLDAPQTTVAAGMLAAGWQVTTFWGPEQMDVWSLTLTHRDVRAIFGIERGFSYGIELAHPGMRRPKPGEAWPSYEQVWLVWARRTGILPRAIDPKTLPTVAGFAAWPKVTRWLATTARSADFAALDALLAVHREHWMAEHARVPQQLTAEERADDAEHAITAPLPRRRRAG